MSGTCVGALIQKDGGEIAIVLDRPLTDAKALVNDPTAFTREMTRILVAKQGHPLIAQMMKPTGSSDPLQIAQPVAPAATNALMPVSPCSFSRLTQSTWGTHGCHTAQYTIASAGVDRGCHHGVPMVDMSLVANEVVSLPL